MSFDWRVYLEVAQALADGRPVENTEAALRAAVGRAYYAAYNVAVDYCKAKGYRFPRDRNSHETVLIHLRAQGLTSTADDLYQLHQWRKYADYESRRSFDLRLMWMGAANAADRIIHGLP
jgi:hypothetical protein